MLQKYLIYCSMFLSVQMFGQGDNAFFNAIKNNDMATVGSYFQEQVDFCLFENQESLNKKEALARLNQFLNNQKPQSIEIIHQGVSKGKTSQFKIAKLTTTKDTYRVFVYSKSNAGHNAIMEIRIDKF